MSLVTRKPVFGVCDQVRHKPTCSATKARQRLEILDIETRDIILPRQQTTMVLLAKECAQSTGKLPRRLAQEQCG